MVKPEPNKMHLEEFQRIMQQMDKEEANSAAYILVRKYPDIVLAQLAIYITNMKGKITDLTCAIMEGED